MEKTAKKVLIWTGCLEPCFPPAVTAGDSALVAPTSASNRVLMDLSFSSGLSDISLMS